MRENADITIYRKKYDHNTKDYVWSRIILKNVNWFSGKHGALSSSKYNRFTVRVFVQNLENQFSFCHDPLYPNDNTFERNDSMLDSNGFYLFDENGRLDVREGDVIVKNIVTYTLPSIARENVPSYEIFNVSSVADNRTGTPYVQHYCIEGV